MAAKRKNPPTTVKSPPKRKKKEKKVKRRPDVPEYHSSPTVKDDRGQHIWPAPEHQIVHARDLIKRCAAAGKPTVICPDKDADGLTSGVILHRTLQLLGLSPDLISVHLLDKGTTVHSDSEWERLASRNPAYLFVLDHGSRSSPALVSSPCTTLIIDHHHSTPESFPAGSSFVTACHSPPVATASLLTYHLCRPLHPLVQERCDYLAIIGTHGDLGTTLKWLPPFPDMSAPLKRYTKKTLNDAVSALNAPRRTASFDVVVAWDALLSADHPKEILTDRRLLEAKQEVAREVQRCTHTPPKFTADGRVAVFRIKSQAQVHPIIATRWAGHLNSKALEVVMCANEGYAEGKVNFSCRVARCAKARGAEVNIIEILKAYATMTTPVCTTGDQAAEPDSDAEKEDDEDDRRPPLIDRLGDDFARGHVQASGGIVSHADFAELMALMRVGEKTDAQKRQQYGGSPTKGKKVIDGEQTNTLMGYFGKKQAAPSGVR